MKYQIYKDIDGFWRWRYKAENGMIIGVSSESYHNRKDCLASIDLMKHSLGALVEDLTENERL